MFDKIQEMIEDPHSIVFLFIDEVESLVCKRPVDKFDSESAFAVRTVNAILTQIDRIKKLVIRFVVLRLYPVALIFNLFYRFLGIRT